MEDRDIQREERAIYALAIVMLLPVVIIALVECVEFGAGATLCLGAVVLGAIGLVASLLRRRERPRVPRAHVRLRGR